MRDPSSFRKNVSDYCRRVRLTAEELAYELHISKGELSKRLNEYSHPKTKRKWELSHGDVFIIVQTLARRRAFTARRQAIELLEMMEYPIHSIDWEADPFKKLHPDPLPPEGKPNAKLRTERWEQLQGLLSDYNQVRPLVTRFVGRQFELGEILEHIYGKMHRLSPAEK